VKRRQICLRQIGERLEEGLRARGGDVDGDEEEEESAVKEEEGGGKRQRLTLKIGKT
jgi:hypothetical protein